MTVTFDASLLVSYYQSRQSQAAAAAQGGVSKTATRVPTAPWTSTTAKAPTSSALVAAALSGARFVDPSAARLDAPGASPDYKDLFALHQGLATLEALATEATSASTAPQRRADLQRAFASGMKEVSAFLDGRPFETVDILRTGTTTQATAAATVKRETASYLTGAVATGSADQIIPDIGPEARTPTAFTMSFARGGGRTTTVSADLSQVPEPRTLVKVTAYLNDQLKAAGLSTRFAVQRTAGGPDTVQAGGKTVTLGTRPDTFALKLTGSADEVPTFSTPAAAPAVYLARGDATSPTLQKLDPAASGAAAKTFERTLPAGVGQVRASVTAPDGSVYLLADAKGAAAGETVKGAADVLLLKYDSAGQLAYTRSLGAAASATGFALAVSPDGKRVAVAGEVTGALGGVPDPLDLTTADSFTAVYDADGVEQWTRRRAATAADGATAVGFAADGSVWVAGQTRSALPGATAIGGQDGYVQSFSAKGAPGFVSQFGASGSDKAVGVATLADGAVVVASQEDGRAVLRRFEPPFAPGAPPSAVRDLGPLDGGELLGVSVAPDGTLRVAGTASGGVSAGQVSAGYAGGREVFAAALSADLQPSASDRLAWWSAGGTADGAAMTTAGGRVYVTGSTPAVGDAGAASGFAVELDPVTGQSGWSRSFTGAVGAVTVDPGGLSVLDRLGLPRGALDYADATDLVSATSLRPGDSFRVAVNGGAARTVTIEAGDTLKALAAKINRATGFASAATVTAVGGRDQLAITPANAGVTLSLSPGPAGADVLRALGLGEGVISKPAAGAKPKPAYALNLGGALDLASVATAKAATARLSAAVTFVRQAYGDLASAATQTTQPGRLGGTVPAGVQARIANYQMALARLTA